MCCQTPHIFFFFLLLLLYGQKYSLWIKCQSNYFLLRQLYLQIPKALIENQAVETAGRYGNVAEKREVWGQQVPEREAWVQNRQWIHQMKLILVELGEEKSPGEGRARAWDPFFLQDFLLCSVWPWHPDFNSSIRQGWSIPRSYSSLTTVKSSPQQHKCPVAPV